MYVVCMNNCWASSPLLQQGKRLDDILQNPCFHIVSVEITSVAHNYFCSESGNLVVELLRRNKLVREFGQEPPPPLRLSMNFFWREPNISNVLSCSAQARSENF